LFDRWYQSFEDSSGEPDRYRTVATLFLVFVLSMTFLVAFLGFSVIVSGEDGGIAILLLACGLGLLVFGIRVRGKYRRYHYGTVALCAAVGVLGAAVLGTAIIPGISVLVMSVAAIYFTLRTEAAELKGGDPRAELE
jgi:peptidoglycan/LPS O-acetylase OafA/YrhL